MHDEPSSLFSGGELSGPFMPLYIKNALKISQYCMVETKVRHANLAVSLEGYMWAISSLTTTTLHIRCLTDSYLEEITPTLKIIYIGNGCKGF